MSKSRVAAVVGALTFYLCGPGSDLYLGSDVGWVCWLFILVHFLRKQMKANHTLLVPLNFTLYNYCAPNLVAWPFLYHVTQPKLILIGCWLSTWPSHLLSPKRSLPKYFSFAFSSKIKHLIWFSFTLSLHNNLSASFYYHW